MTPSKDYTFPWKSLGFGQLMLFLFSLLAFLDMHSRMETAKLECGCLNGRVEYERGQETEDFDDFEEEREKRSLKESLFNYTANDGSSNKKELWVHSLSKIQMDELLEKCLSVHQYCTSDDNEARGPPGPPISFFN